jgi:hypothetical protein
MREANIIFDGGRLFIYLRNRSFTTDGKNREEIIEKYICPNPPLKKKRKDRMSKFRFFASFGRRTDNTMDKSEKTKE